MESFNILCGSKCVEAHSCQLWFSRAARFNILCGSKCVEAAPVVVVDDELEKVSISSADRSALKQAAETEELRTRLGFNILCGSKCVEAAILAFDQIAVFEFQYPLRIEVR